jgi:hypothetical protein
MFVNMILAVLAFGLLHDSLAADAKHLTQTTERWPCALLSEIKPSTF